jgi:hypothetical protein
MSKTDGGENQAILEALQSLDVGGRKSYSGLVMTCDWWTLSDFGPSALGGFCTDGYSFELILYKRIM